MSEIISQNKPELAMQKNVTDSVLLKIKELAGNDGIKMPDGYNPGNALKAAWLELQKVKNKDNVNCGTCCTKESIVNALFDMCIQGLSPAKNQCYFVVRGNELDMTRSYFGTVTALKRLKGVSDVFAQVVYEGDVFEYDIENGNTVIKKHQQKLENIDVKKIIAAYSVIIKDGIPRAEIMPMAMIRQSWTHTSSRGKVQEEFPDQMAKRTVLNRGAKMYINTCSDSDILAGAINRTTENEYEEEYQDHEIICENAEPIMLPEPEEKKPEKPKYRHPEKADRDPGF